MTENKPEHSQALLNMVHIIYKQITEKLIAENKTISTMESCTGGLIASLISDTEGASAVLRGAMISYCNESKILHGVPSEIIEKYGVYSQETAVAMAETCRSFYGTDIGVGITGTFGNVDPNNSDSVPGKVYFSIATKRETVQQSVDFEAGMILSRFEYKLYTALSLGRNLANITKICS